MPFEMRPKAFRSSDERLGRKGTQSFEAFLVANKRRRLLGAEEVRTDVIDAKAYDAETDGGNLVCCCCRSL